MTNSENWLTHLWTRAGAVLMLAITLAACPAKPPVETSFVIAVLPDTQNMIDYKHQSAAGFQMDASKLFMGQMNYIAANAKSAGGEIAFVTAVGDVWQHQSIAMDAEHAARGFALVPNPYFATEVEASPNTQAIELPTARAGYGLISGKVPFAVAPGNHDYDAMWADSKFPAVAPQELAAFSAQNPGADISRHPELLGMLHIGGLNNFRSVFGADTPFFKDKPWYVASYRGGADSAQKFTAGGYTFLHFALEMSPEDDVLAWVESVIAANPGLPTIISTHDFLSTAGERHPNPIIDLKAADARHNNAEDLWTKLISRHDQIFMVLCGHQHGQAMRVDTNEKGHQVYQILADYQDRGQSAIDAGVPLVRGRAVGIGDGWLRLMTFDTGAAVPTVKVRTYSPHYNGYSTALPTYAAWYKPFEKPQLSDADYLKADDFVIELTDFKARFGPPK